MNFEQHGIPLYMREGIQLYVDGGRPAGHFLMAVFENDLHESAIRADDTNIYLLRDYALFMYGEMPRKSWGSKAKVRAWMKHHGLAELEPEDEKLEIDTGGRVVIKTISEV